MADALTQTGNGAHRNETEKFVKVNGEIAVRTNPFISYMDNIALGNIPGTEFRSFFGSSVVGEGVGNEQVLGDGQTTRYPFPSSPAQMTIVSTSADDNFAGTGARVLLVRGNITGNVDFFESVLLTGTTPVTTVNSYLRVNSIIVVNTGSGGVNAGTITLKNGADLLAQANIGTNLSRTAVYSIPAGVTGIVKEVIFATGKDDSGVTNAHFFLSTLGNVDLKAIFSPSYQNQTLFTSESPLAFPEGSDVEFTGYSKEGAGNSELSAVASLTLVDNE